jgi:hypothetical protein
MSDNSEVTEWLLMLLLLLYGDPTLDAEWDDASEGRITLSQPRH